MRVIAAPLLFAVAVCSCVNSIRQPVEHVILVGLDGLQVSALHEALANGDAPHLQNLRETGAYTDTARAQFPSVSMPNWGNVLYGTGIELTGIQGNDWNRNMPFVYPNEGPCVYFPNVFTVAKLQNSSLKTAAFYTWNGIDQLIEPTSNLDTVQFDNCEGCEQCLDVEPKLAAKFISAFKQNLYSLSFLYMDATDECGHEYGTHNVNYTKSIKMVDSVIGDIRDAVDQVGVADKTVIMVTSDHGREKCTGHDHGGFSQSEMTLQWIVHGPGVKKGLKLRSPVQTMDNAPTMLHALGLREPTQWRGRPVYEAFEGEEDKLFFVPVQGPSDPSTCKSIDDLRNCSTIA